MLNLIFQVFINFAKQQTELADDEVDELPEDLAYLGKNIVVIVSWFKIVRVYPKVLL